MSSQYKHILLLFSLEPSVFLQHDPTMRQIGIANRENNELGCEKRGRVSVMISSVLDKKASLLKVHTLIGSDGWRLLGIIK